MKKLLMTILAAIFVVFTCVACEEPTDNPAPKPPTTTEKEGEPEFPNNEYGSDNDAAYPEIWK